MWDHCVFGSSKKVTSELGGAYVVRGLKVVHDRWWDSARGIWIRSAVMPKTIIAVYGQLAKMSKTLRPSRSTCEQGRRCMDCPLACLLAVAAFRELSLWIDPLLLHGTGSASAAFCVPRPRHVHRSLRSLGLLPEEAGHMRSCTVLIRQWERDTWGFVPRAFAPLLEANGRRVRDIEYLSPTVCPLL